MKKRVAAVVVASVLCLGPSGPVGSQGYPVIDKATLMKVAEALAAQGEQIMLLQAAEKLQREISSRIGQATNGLVNAESLGIRVADFIKYVPSPTKYIFRRSADGKAADGKATDRAVSTADMLGDAVKRRYYDAAVPTETRRVALKNLRDDDLRAASVAAMALVQKWRSLAANAEQEVVELATPLQNASLTTQVQAQSKILMRGQEMLLQQNALMAAMLEIAALQEIAHDPNYVMP